MITQLTFAAFTHCSQTPGHHNHVARPSCRNTYRAHRQKHPKGERVYTDGLQTLGNRIEPPHDQIQLRSSNSHTQLRQLTRSLGNAT
jgi:hypothetical protein